MKLIKKIAFFLLALACIGAAALLFLPDTCPVRMGIMHMAGVPQHPSEPTPAPDTPVQEETPLPVTVDDAEVEEWNTYHGDNALCGVAAGNFPDKFDVLWSVMAGAPVRVPPVVHQNIIVVVNSLSEIRALKPDGTLLWKKEIRAPETGNDAGREVRVDAPIAAAGGKIFLGTDMGDVAALDILTGKALWWTSIGGAVLGTPNYTDDEKKVVVIDQDTGGLVCLDAVTGSQVWKSTGADRSDASPAVYNNKAVYGSCASAVHVIDLASGTYLHDIAIHDGGGQIAHGVAVFGRFAYAGVRDGRAVCADLEAGAFKWMTTVSELEVFCTPAVNEAWVIVTSYDGRVHGMHRETGEIKWEHDLGGTPSSPVLLGDNIAVTSDGVFYLLRTENGERLQELRIADDITSPAVMKEMILLGTEDGMITVLGGVAENLSSQKDNGNQ